MESLAAIDPPFSSPKYSWKASPAAPVQPPESIDFRPSPAITNTAVADEALDCLLHLGRFATDKAVGSPVLPSSAMV